MPAAPPASAAPATAAPSPTPAAPPTSAAAPPAPARSKTASEDWMADANSDLDALSASEGKSGAPPKDKGPKRSAPVGKSPEEPKGADEAPGHDEPPEPGQAPPGDGKAPAGEPAKPVKARELREAYEGLKAKVKTELEPEVTRLRARVTELEQGNGSVPKEVQERLTAAEKRAADLEQHIRFVDYSKSQEYQQKFWQPYVKAWADATRELKGLTMKGEDEAGNETSREVTEADLQYFATLEPGVRRAEINRLFPEDKEEVKRHINEISRLFDVSQSALKQAHEQADATVKSASEQQRQAQASRAKLWKEMNQGLAQKYPAWFAPADGDTEGNGLFDKGRALADLVFSPQDLTKESLDLLPKAFAETIRAGKPFTQEQLVRMHAIIRNKAANHDRLAHKVHGAQERIKELEESLKQYEESGPDGVPAGGKVPRGTKDFMGEAAAELEAIDRAHPA